MSRRLQTYPPFSTVCVRNSLACDLELCPLVLRSGPLHGAAREALVEGDCGVGNGGLCLFCLPPADGHYLLQGH